MAIIIRTVTNTTPNPIQLFVPGYDEVKSPVIIPATTTVDLFTVLTADQLEAIQPILNTYIEVGEFTVVATVDTSTFSPVGGSGVVARVTVNGNSTSIPDTLLYTPIVAGMYRVSIYSVSTAVSGSDDAGVTLSWTDTSGAQVDVPVMSTLDGTAGGNNIVFLIVGQTFSSTTNIYSTAGTPISYSLTYNDNGGGLTGTYTIYYVVEQL